MMIYLCLLLRSPVSRLSARRASALPIFIALLLIVCAVLPAAASEREDAAEAQRTLTATIRTKNFTVHYDPEKKLLSDTLADIAQQELLRISRELGYQTRSGRPFPLYIYPSHINFIKAGGLETSDFTVGTASSGSEAISVDASGTFALPEKVIAHEVTHAVIFRILGPNVAKLPLWLNEGLAKCQSNDFGEDDRSLITDAASSGMLIPLPRLMISFPKDRTALAYAESTSAAYYLMKTHGKTSPRVILRELARSGSLDNAMVKATGRNTAEFEADWYDFSMKKYWSVRVTQIGLQVVSALMAVLAVLAFLARRKRKTQAAKEWEWEQFNESMRKQLDDERR